MNTIGRSESTPVNRYQDQNAIQPRRLRQNDPTEVIRDKQIAKNIQVHSERLDYQQNAAVQLRKQQQKSEQEANIRNKQIAKDTQVHNK